MSHPLLILTAPTRFGLAQGSAFDWFEKGCLPSGVKLSDCKILERYDGGSYPRCLILGGAAFSRHFPGYTSVEKYRGGLLNLNNIPTTVTFHPQDADDFKSSEDDLDDGDESGSNEKDVALTQRRNYRFWIRADTRKLFAPFTPRQKEEVIIAPRLEDITALLLKCKDQRLFLDIECRRGDQSLNCIGLAVNNGPVYVIPIYDYRNNLFYSSPFTFFRALSLALSSNTVIIHNAMFDLFVLCYRYHCHFSWSVFDTMLAHHRCFPEVEKDLGHVISYWTWLPYHKDENIENPRNASQQQQLWEYNAKDVYGMREVYKKQLEYISAHNLTESVARANNCIYPYLTTTLTGLQFSEAELSKKRAEHRARLDQLTRIGSILIGRSNFNLNSTQQAINFFHKTLGYDVQGRTDSNAPSLGRKELFKLRLKYPNPLIDVIIAYRLLQKELSMLSFQPLTPLNPNL